jgi:hypothetical protein
VALSSLDGRLQLIEKGGKTMTNRNNNRNQPHTGGSKSADTEFGGELTQSKKARKKAARESKNNSK